MSLREHEGRTGRRLYKRLRDSQELSLSVWGIASLDGCKAVQSHGPITSLPKPRLKLLTLQGITWRLGGILIKALLGSQKEFWPCLAWNPRVRKRLAQSLLEDLQKAFFLHSCWGPDPKLYLCLYRYIHIRIHISLFLD